MNLETFYEYCLSKNGVTEHFPFDEETLVFKVGGKMFALSSLKEWEKGTPSVNLKCDPEKAIELREKFSCVLPGYHMNKRHWNTIICDGSANRQQIQEWIDDSYHLVVSSLTKKLKTQLESL